MTRQRNQSLGYPSSRKIRRSRKQSRARRILCESNWETPDRSVWTAPRAAYPASRRCEKLQQARDQCLTQGPKAFYNQISTGWFQALQKMTHREQDVLHSIVESYIQTGEPVASRTIAKLGKDHLSPATIRNVMADLYDGGYLAQPHTSAGRVPTEKAFRSYVQSLTRGRVLVTELQRLRAELSRLSTM